MTVTPPTFLIGQHPDRGTLWAAIDANSRFLEGQVAERRFGAYVAPFRDQEAAREALKVAGVHTVEIEPARKRRS